MLHDKTITLVFFSDFSQLSGHLVVFRLFFGEFLVQNFSKQCIFNKVLFWEIKNNLDLAVHCPVTDFIFFETKMGVTLVHAISKWSQLLFYFISCTTYTPLQKLYLTHHFCLTNIIWFVRYNFWSGVFIVHHSKNQCNGIVP